MRPGGVSPTTWQAEAEALALEALEGGLDATLLQQRLDRIGCPRCDGGPSGQVLTGETAFWWHPDEAGGPSMLRTSGLPGPEQARTLVLGRPVDPIAAGPDPA